MREKKMSLSYLLNRDGLGLETLVQLSYKSTLYLSLKNNLNKFNEDDIFHDLNLMIRWYDSEVHDFLSEIPLDYRIKSLSSCLIKYRRYFPDKPVEKVFNDTLGFRALCKDYDDVLDLGFVQHVRVIDMSKGKANDDGYRGIHLYFQLDHRHYPIEIQYNSYYDRPINDWLHKYVYKRDFDTSVGVCLRDSYEKGEINNENDFVKELKNVLYSGKKV